MAAATHDSADGCNNTDDAIVHNILELTFESSLLKFLHLILLESASFEPSESCKADHHSVHNVYCCIYNFSSNCFPWFDIVHAALFTLVTRTLQQHGSVTDKDHC